MNTNRHNETNQRSGTLDDLSIPILKTVNRPRHCLPEKIACSRCSPPDVRSQKSLMPCAGSSKISRADLSVESCWSILSAID